MTLPTGGIHFDVIEQGRPSLGETSYPLVFLLQVRILGLIDHQLRTQLGPFRASVCLLVLCFTNTELSGHDSQLIILPESLCGI